MPGPQTHTYTFNFKKQCAEGTDLLDLRIGEAKQKKCPRSGRFFEEKHCGRGFLQLLECNWSTTCIKKDATTHRVGHVKISWLPFFSGTVAGTVPGPHTYIYIYREILFWKRNVLGHGFKWFKAQKTKAEILPAQRAKFLGKTLLREGLRNYWEREQLLC